jgi:site-specific DNA-cytosine methylase
MIMGFTEGELGRPFTIPVGVSESQAYKQFGNAVVIPQIKWLGKSLVDRYGDVLAARMDRLPSE